MLLSEKWLISLEDAHYGRLSVEDKRALDLAFEKEPLLKSEAEVYLKIWQGFDALKSQQQALLFHKWEQDWLEYDETELIEWYVNGELGEETTKRLDNKCKNTPSFATKVASFKTIQGGFDSLKSENFRTEMESWGTQPQAKEPSGKKPGSLSVSWKRPLSIAAAILFLITASFLWWNHDQVSNASLVASYYKTAATGNNLSGETTIGTYLKLFEKGHFSMNEKDYPEAIKTFRLLKEQALPAEWPESERKHYAENVEWNLLLAMLGDGQTGGDFNQNLDQIARNNQHEYQSNAIELQQKLASFWRF